MKTIDEYESIIADNFKSLNGKCYLTNNKELILAKYISGPIKEPIDKSIMAQFELIDKLK